MGRTLVELDDMPYAEYLRWRAYMNVRNALRRHDANVAAMRSGR